MNIKDRSTLLARTAEEDVVPEELLTPEQQRRRYNRLKKRKERASKRQEKAASEAASEREWFEGNRASLRAVTEMLHAHKRVSDLLEDMQTVLEGRAFDEEFASHVERDVVADVKEFGVIHLSTIVKDHDIPADWGEGQYWKDNELLAKLENEGKQTAIYIRYGLLTSLVDWRVVEFLMKRGWNWWKAAELVGWYETSSIIRHR